MHDNDFKQILNSSKENLITLVKKWRTVSPDITTFSAIVLEELGAWDSIAESIDDFCNEFGSSWDSTKTHFFATHQVSGFTELKDKFQTNSTSGPNLNNEKGLSINPIKDAGDALKDVASAFSTLLWSSIIATVLVMILILSNMDMEDLGVAITIIQVFFSLIVLASFSNIIAGLRRAGNHLNKHIE